MFADAPTLKTKGRYYFTPAETPFVESWHNLGSRDWNDSNWQHVQALGEDLTCPQPWDAGALPAVVPSPIQVGTSLCLQNGEISLQGIPANTLINGFPQACFVAAPTPSKSWEAASAFSSCSIQLMSAQLINWSYDQLEAVIRAFLTPFLGPAWSITYTPPTPTLPAVICAVSPLGTLAWVDGTANFQQFALQAAYGLQPPGSVGAWSTSRFWYDAGIYIHTVLAANGALPTAPVFLCGHSYGGVACLSLAALYRSAQPTRTVRWLTFGCPHIGDQRFADLIARCSGMAIANDSDIVTAIPFDGDLVYNLATFFVDPRFLGWLAWKAPPQRWLMDANGVLTPDALPILDWPTLLGFATDVLASLPYPDVAAHRIPTYFSRTLTRCPFPEWPLDANDYARLVAGYNILWEDGTDLETEGGDVILVEA